MTLPDTTRRRFVAGFSTLGLSSTLLPGVLWAQMQASGSNVITVPMIKEAAKVAGITFTDGEYDNIVKQVNQTLGRIEKIRAQKIPNDVAPPFYFSPVTPGMKVDKTAAPIRFSKRPVVKRPANLELVAYWSIPQLAQLIRSKQATSLELTQMYLSRLRRYNDKINFVVTMLDDVAIAQAKQADAELAAGKDRGPLHGIPWVCKDIISVANYPTTWGSSVYREQVFDYDATVVEMLRDAGAVLLAKVVTGELAGNDIWYGGRTNNPWKLDEGSTGSSAGTGAAVAAGCAPFGLGTETGGSILSPSARCGITGLRPTFGRVSRYGVMALSWTQDRLGPMCRFVEDCAIVMSVIAKPDGRDLAVSDVPFNWDVTMDWRKLKVGYLPEAFADVDRVEDWKKNDATTLDKLKSMGVQLIPLKIPEFDTELTMLSVESATFHNKLVNSDNWQKLTDKTYMDRNRASRLIPAVDYLQSQRLRAVMMKQLAEATASVDMYLAPSTNGNPRLPEGVRPPIPAPPPNFSQRHSQMANLACYPGLAVPNGLANTGAPTSILFMAQPYHEAKLLALAKAYQDATDFHLQQPPLFAVR